MQYRIFKILDTQGSHVEYARRHTWIDAVECAKSITGAIAYAITEHMRASTPAHVIYEGEIGAPPHAATSLITYQPAPLGDPTFWRGYTSWRVEFRAGNELQRVPAGTIADARQLAKIMRDKGLKAFAVRG